MRAPEEYLDGPLSEKIDVWSLGSIMFVLLTGLVPFYYLNEDAFRSKIKKGEVPSLRSFYKHKEQSFEEAELTRIMNQCWKYDARDRISIFEVVSELERAVQTSFLQIQQQNGISVTVQDVLKGLPSENPFSVPVVTFEKEKKDIMGKETKKDDGDDDSEDIQVVIEKLT
jgi:serine/threonine protein kinase